MKKYNVYIARIEYIRYSVEEENADKAVKKGRRMFLRETPGNGFVNGERLEERDYAKERGYE